MWQDWTTSLKGLTTNFLAKVDKIPILDILKNITCKVKTALATFGSKIDCFYSNNWANCSIARKRVNGRRNQMLKLDILRRRRREKFERRFGIEMCVPVWPELANFGEIFKFSGNFYRVNNYFVKHWTHFGKLSAIGYILIVLSGLILSKSSCLLVTLTFREGRVWSNSLPRYVGRWLPSKLRQA